MEAQTLNCPNCGAAISSDALCCQYCESKLATVACPACFGMMFIGSKFCPHCGAAPGDVTSAALSILKCPRCKVGMSSVTIGAEQMRECEQCAGIWLEVAAFEKICASREEQSGVLGGALPITPPKAVTSGALGKINYIPCPQCGQLMNRINFARCSGVIVDVCKGHGTWFDRDELSEIIQFIRGGGLGLSREKEKMEIEEQREQLRAEQHGAAIRELNRHYPEDERISGLSAAGGLLKFLI